MTSARVVSYQLDDGTIAQFEIEPVAGFVPAGTGSAAARLREAAGPVVAAAKELLDQVVALRPEEVEVRFGVKVTGTTHWLVARTAGEGSFEVSLRWRPEQATVDPGWVP